MRIRLDHEMVNGPGGFYLERGNGNHFFCPTAKSSWRADNWGAGKSSRKRIFENRKLKGTE